MLKSKKSILIIIGIILVIFLFVYLINNTKTRATNSNSNVSATSTKSGSLNLYPNLILTPGDIFPVSKEDICIRGYSKGVRNVPIEEKRQVYAEYNIPYPEPQGSYEVDHFISLELGGSNDIKNLWPEPALPVPGFHEKDKVENYLHEQVCSGNMTLPEAQREISTDWYAVYLKIAH